MGGEEEIEQAECWKDQKEGKERKGKESRKVPSESKPIARGV